MKFMKGLRVNSGIKYIVQSKDSGEHSYGVCRKRVGRHTRSCAMCMECLKWNHSLERTERMEVRWVCGVDRKVSDVFYSLLVFIVWLSYG